MPHSGFRHCGLALLLLLGLPRCASAQRGQFRIQLNPTGAMEPTASIRDIITYDLAWADSALERGTGLPTPRFQDLVVFTLPGDSVPAFKRVLGLPGDTLAMVAGTLLRNGRQVIEPYVQHTKPTFRGDTVDIVSMRTWQLPYLIATSPASYAPDLQDWGPLVVPPRSMAVFGDNRDESYDTRYLGFIPYRNLRGRVLRIWSAQRGALTFVRDTARP